MNWDPPTKAKLAKLKLMENEQSSKMIFFHVHSSSDDNTNYNKK